MEKFAAHLLEGVFFLGDKPYPDAQGFVCKDFRELMVSYKNQTPVSVYPVLQALVGQEVQIAVHQCPQPPFTGPGLGSCLWPKGCPYGHQNVPKQLFQLAERGVLVYDLDHEHCSGGWWIEKFDGSRVMLPLVIGLVGHHGRIAIATIMQVEKLRDVLENKQ